VGDALGAELVGVGIVRADAAGELGACEQGVVGVGCVVPVEFGISCIVVPLGSVELFLGVGVGPEDGTERLEGAFGSEFGVKVVEDGEVDQGLVLEVEAEVGLGPEVEQVELQVHSEDGSGMGEPSGEVPSVGGDVELEDEGRSGGEVFQSNISTGNRDGNGLNKVTLMAPIRIDGAGGVEDGLFGEESASGGESCDSIGLDVQANGAGIGVAGCPGRLGRGLGHGSWR
jgi:hypothetical protein